MKLYGCFFIIPQPKINKYDDENFIIEKEIMTILPLLKL